MKFIKIYIKDIQLIAILFFFWLLFFWPVIFAGEIYFSEDISNQTFPFKSFLLQGLRDGKIYLWNPYVFSGMPFIGNIQAGIFYPLNIILLLCPLARSLSFFIILHHLLAGFFMYIYIRSLNLSPFTALFSSLAFMFSGNFVNSIPSITLYTITWIPLVLFFIEKLINTENIFYSLPAGLVIAIQIFAGHIQYIYMFGIFIFLYALYPMARSFIQKNNRKGLIILSGMLLMYFIAAGLSAIQLLPLFEVTQHNFRQGGISEVFYTSSFWNLFDYLIPSYKLSLGYEESGRIYCTYHVGIFVLLMAFSSLFFKKSSYKIYLFFMSFLFWLISLGNLTPLHYLLYNYFPFYNMFRFPERFLSLISLWLALLAAFGMEELLNLIANKEENMEKKKMLVIFSVISLLFFLPAVMFLIIPFLKEVIESIYWKLPGIVSVFLISLLICYLILYVSLKSKISLWLKKILIILFLLCELFMIGMKVNPTVSVKVIFEEMQVPDSIKKDKTFFRILSRTENPAMAANYGMVYNISDISGYDPIVLKRYMNYYIFSELGHLPTKENMDLSITAGNSISLTRIESPLLDILNLKYSFVKEKKQTLVIINEHYLSRFFMAPRCLVIKDEVEILETLNSSNFNPEECVILEEEPPVKQTSSEPANYEITNVEYSPDKISMDLFTEHEGFLFFSEVYYPGWQCRIDNMPVKVYRADYTFRSVYIDEPGKHRIEMQFLPGSYEMGRYITVTFLIIFIILSSVRAGVLFWKKNTQVIFAVIYLWNLYQQQA